MISSPPILEGCVISWEANCDGNFVSLARMTGWQERHATMHSTMHSNVSIVSLICRCDIRFGTRTYDSLGCAVDAAGT